MEKVFQPLPLFPNKRNQPLTMENLYLFIVIVLFGVAISDLIVGVSNDAVNFLNSAIGSKAAPFKVIMLIASLGILIGATFSSGMMEVARKGIFHPDMFTFSEIMVLFLAVMLTDVILLDLFNTFGLPTSTTVSIVFELLGAAMAMAIIKTSHHPEMGTVVSQYINSGGALFIISGILLSIVIAFSLGALVQYIVRIAFTFNFQKQMKYFGAIWGGIATTAITYFMLIKGAKGSAFITDTTLNWIMDHTMLILLISFLGWTLILQLLMWLVKVNILRVVVLVGTFALAMAFAGNDLVNFIGVPLAGFASFRNFMAEGADPEVFTMEALSGPVQTPTYFLLLAGIVMAFTLWLSRKARSVTETEINLGRQDEGYERFQPNAFSRFLVRASMNISRGFRTLVPVSLQEKLGKRFDQTEFASKNSAAKDTAYFDLVRASVNLVVASIIISFATSMKLPLSTTYVTFMVAMGSSMSDRAWGRESAVYRISGVLTVIGGWFITALIAFTISLVIGFIIYYGGFVAILVLIVLIGFLIFRTHIIHKRREADMKLKQEALYGRKIVRADTVLSECNKNVTSTVISMSMLYYLTLENFFRENRRGLKKVRQEIKELNKHSKELKYNIYITIRQLEEDSVESGPYYVQVLDYIREGAHCVNFIMEHIYEHVENNHAPFNEDQKKEFIFLNEEISVFFNFVLNHLKQGKFDDLSEIIEKQKHILDIIAKMNKKQVKRIKKGESGTKTSLLYFNVLAETKNLMLYTLNILKAQRDFVIYSRENGILAP